MILVRIAYRDWVSFCLGCNFDFVSLSDLLNQEQTGQRLLGFQTPTSSLSSIWTFSWCPCNHVPATYTNYS